MKLPERAYYVPDRPESALVLLKQAISTMRFLWLFTRIRVRGSTRIFADFLQFPCRNFLDIGVKYAGRNCICNSKSANICSVCARTALCKCVTFYGWRSCSESNTFYSIRFVYHLMFIFALGWFQNNHLIAWHKAMQSDFSKISRKF